MPKTPDPAEGSRVWTELFNIVDGVVDQTPMSWRAAPGVRPSDEYLAVNGFYGLIRLPAPQVDLRVERVEMQAIKDWVRDDVAHTVTQGWRIIRLTPGEQALVAQQQWDVVRAERNFRLRETDFTQLSDYTNLREEWATYRQALRDVPETNSDPFNIQWPVPPAGGE